MRTRLHALSFLVFAGTMGVCHGQAADVARGSYLVNQMGKCGDCHTPKGPHGIPDKARWLKGSPLGFQPLAPVPGWASTAPDLTATSALWTSWGENGLVEFFISGKTPDGKAPGSPMPQYTLKDADARAIVAYLKSLN